MRYGKKVEVCDGFSCLPKDFFIVETTIQEPPKVIA